MGIIWQRQVRCANRLTGNDIQEEEIEIEIENKFSRPGVKYVK